MKVPCALANAQLKCMVWGYDAINFIHKHRTFSSTPALHLLVADSEIQLCAEAIATELPNLQSDRGFQTFPRLPICKDTAWGEPLAFPHSVCLKFQSKRGRIPRVVLLHPQSQFYINIQDYSRSFALRQFPDNIRIPTLAAFLDSLIEVHSDPPTGYDNKNLGRLLVNWEFDLFEGALGYGSQLLPNGRLRFACSHVEENLKVENRPYFEAMARGGRSAPLLDTRPHRRSLLGCVCRCASLGTVDYLCRGRSVQPAVRPPFANSSEDTISTKRVSQR